VARHHARVEGPWRAPNTLGHHVAWVLGGGPRGVGAFEERKTIKTTKKRYHDCGPKRRAGRCPGVLGAWSGMARAWRGRGARQTPSDTTGRGFREGAKGVWVLSKTPTKNY
jgi:hypothetical protein